MFPLAGYVCFCFGFGVFFFQFNRWIISFQNEQNRSCDIYAILVFSTRSGSPIDCTGHWKSIGQWWREIGTGDAHKRWILWRRWKNSAIYRFFVFFLCFDFHLLRPDIRFILIYRLSISFLLGGRVGHVDFCVNGGKRQPYCTSTSSMLEIAICVC